MVDKTLALLFSCWYPYDQLIFISYGLPLGITALVITTIPFIPNLSNKNMLCWISGNPDCMVSIVTICFALGIFGLNYVKI